MKLLEEIIGGIIAAVVIVYLGSYLPYWLEGAALLGALALSYGVADIEYRSGVLVAVWLALFYFLLGQPVLAAGAIVVVAATIFVATLVKDPFAVFDWHWTVWIAASLALAVLAASIGGAAVAGVFWACYFRLLPVVAAYGPAVWNFMPLLAVAGSIVLVAFASWRQPVGESSNYWLVTPVCSALFALFFWPSHSHLAQLVVIATGFWLSAYAHADRATEESKIRSYGTFRMASLTGVIFAGLFIAGNNIDWFYRYQLANAVSVTEIDSLPASKNLRLKPFVAARDYCVDANQDGYAFVSDYPRPIFVTQGGRETMYWQCMVYPRRFQGHSYTYPLGGMDGFIMVDAGMTERHNLPVNVPFLIGDRSVIALSAFAARHPFSSVQPSVGGRTVAGNYDLLKPFKSTVIQWGGMLPEQGGVMVIHPNGIFQDLTLSQAAERYPGVPLYPTELARMYADAWAHDSSLWAKLWSGRVMEISDNGPGTDSSYPTWQSFEDGHWGVIPFEPIGEEAKGLNALALIDPVTGDMKVYYLRSDASSDVGSRSRVDNLTGPRQILGNVAADHPGLNGVKLGEALLVVPRKTGTGRGEFCWSAALMQSSVGRYHGYAFNSVANSQGKFLGDVHSSAEIDKIVEEKGCN